MTIKVVTDHGWPKASDGTDDGAFEAFKNERDHIAQNGRMKPTVAAMDWAARALEAKDAEIKRLTAQIEIDGKLIATLQAERDHWSGLVSRADHALFPFALEQSVTGGKE